MPMPQPTIGITKIILRFGFCHTVVLDKDSKFFGVCREALDLLQINCHVLSGSNHNPMLIEWLNHLLQSGSPNYVQQAQF
jgi:hypothetical protein